MNYRKHVSQRQNIFLLFQLEGSGAGDMDTTSNISENELGKNLNGSTLSSSTAATDSSPAAEEGPRWTRDRIMLILHIYTVVGSVPALPVNQSLTRQLPPK